MSSHDTHGQNVLRQYLNGKKNGLLNAVLSVVELGFPKDGRYESAKKQICDSVNDFFREMQTEINRNYDLNYKKTETIQLSEK